jgi:ATP-dependent DNA helicase RecQ
LTLVFRDPHWILIDAAVRTLGRMAKTWKPPEGHVFSDGHVGAIITWRKADNGEDFIRYLKRDSWETVLPEMIFQPCGVAGSDRSTTGASGTHQRRNGTGA